MTTIQSISDEIDKLVEANTLSAASADEKMYAYFQNGGLIK